MSEPLPFISPKRNTPDTSHCLNEPELSLEASELEKLDDAHERAVDLGHKNPFAASLAIEMFVTVLRFFGG